MSWKSKDDQRRMAATRYRNARFLLLERSGGNVARFARTIKQSHSYANAYVSEKPNKRIGDVVARRIEESFNTSPGWLDKDHANNWNRRLREATGGRVHPLDRDSMDDSWQQLDTDSEQSLATRQAETPEEVRSLGLELEKRLRQTSRELYLLQQKKQSLMAQTAPMYQPLFEQWALEQGYVVETPQQVIGTYYRLWHPNKQIKFSLEVRIACYFKPALEFRPLPPAAREVVAIPIATQEQVLFLFMALDERISPFDVTHLLYVPEDDSLVLTSNDGKVLRSMDQYRDIERLFPESES